jgi:hypothetical protein
MMKRILTLLAALVSISAAQAEQNPKYTLYYLDKTRNVVSVGISADGKAVSTTRKLTSKGGYDGYCVSPDGNQVFGWRKIRRGQWFGAVYSLFLERNGRTQEKIPGTWGATSGFRAGWSPQNKHLIVSIDQTVGCIVETETIIYSLERRKVVCDTRDSFYREFSDDEAYLFVLGAIVDAEDNPAWRDGACWLSVMDMETGRMTKVVQVNSDAIRGGPLQSMWLGKSHKFAFINYRGKLSAGEASRGKSRPLLNKWALAKNGQCSDLHYVAGMGIYFTKKIGKTSTAYYSRDLQTLSKTAVLPSRQAAALSWTQTPEGEIYSPDKVPYAAIKNDEPDKIGMIKIYDKSGGFLADIAQGTKPKWRGGTDWESVITSPW